MRFSALSLMVLGAQAALTYKGADWSSLLVEEAAGRTYKNAAGVVQPLETILKASGVNTVRQRVWVNPAGGDYGLAYNVKLAKRAKAAGLNVFVDFHYSDIWADPGHQGKPAGWANLNIDDLANEIYVYTKTVMNTFAAAGVNPTLVSIGNEITAGMLFDTGRLPTGAYNLARLLHSASAGVRDSNTSPKILVHLDKGWDFGTQQYWYDLVLKQGPFTLGDFDVQAVSYYPFYNENAKLSSLGSSLAQMRAKYHKEVQVVETDWPLECTNPKYKFPSDTAGILPGVAGQTTWMKTVASVVQKAGGNGLFYWEPAWIGNANLGSSCESNVMFDATGRALSSLSVFGAI